MKLKEYGCLMLKLDIPQWDLVLNFIKGEDVNKHTDKGLEEDPHVTILFGLDPDIKETDIEEFVKENIKKPLKIKLTDISNFKQDEFDVLKFGVESEDLIELNKKLSDRFSHTSEFDYHPHLTIAFLNKNSSDKYLNIDNFNIIEIESNVIKFSNPDMEREYII